MEHPHKSKKTYSDKLKSIAEDTVERVNNALHSFGVMGEQIQKSIDGTTYYEKYSDFGYKDIKGDDKYKLDTHQETTMNGIFTLEGQGKTIALNFASAKRPGGGFLKGTVAQEESLARSSSLYNSLVKCPEYYENPQFPYYSDKMIYSPDVVFFKNDDGDVIDPVLCSIITCAAPNLNEATNVDYSKVRDIFVSRIYNVLKLSEDKGYDNVILGAWGCGVFRNDPKFVSKYFRWVIKQEFSNSFKNIRFSIFDKSGFIINPFK